MEVFISLGSNMDDPKANLDNAISMLQDRVEFNEIKVSKFYVTSPVDFLDQPDFINCAVVLKTEISCQAVHEITKDIEKKIGTGKTSKNGPRRIDLDLIFYGPLIINNTHLKVPHPKMHFRKFVLIPVCELNKDFIHPGLNKTVQQCLNEVSDKKNEEKVTVLE